MLEVTAADMVAADPTIIALINGIPLNYSGCLATDRALLCASGGGYHIAHWCPDWHSTDLILNGLHLVSFYCPIEELFNQLC